MAAIAQVQNGKIVESTSASSLADSVKKSGSTLDKDAFLGLLVAQMKYQDPLEPTSNTEFISQYATFSELEQMQNMSATLELSRASSLVGQIVSVNTTDSKGETTQIQGKVDYVIYENNKAYVSIGGALYSLDDVYGVADQEYLDAYDLALEFAVAMNKLPKKENLTLDDKETIDKLNEIYNGMSVYEKTFIASDYVTQLKEYTEHIEKLTKEQEENNAANLASEFVAAMKKLPEKENLTLDDKKTIDELNEIYDGMSDYEKTFVASDYVTKLKEYTERMEELAKE